MKSPVVRWLLSLPAAMFYCIAASALANGRGGEPALATILATFLLANSVALWVLADSRQRQHPIRYDLGSLVFFTWTVSAPLYLFSTRGWRAFGPLGWFILLYVGAALLGNLPFIIYSLRQ